MCESRVPRINVIMSENIIYHPAACVGDTLIIIVVLNQMAQEIGLIPEEEDYVNPFRTDTPKPVKQMC